MGRRGPPPTPTEILKARGSRRAQSRGETPDGDRNAPYCPDWLSASAREVWGALIPRLQALGVLRNSDLYALSRYCATFVLWRAAMQHVAEHGDTESSETGTVISAKARLLKQYGDTLSRLESQYGLTASARASLSIKPDAKPEHGQRGKARFFGTKAFSVVRKADGA